MPLLTTLAGKCTIIGSYHVARLARRAAQYAFIRRETSKRSPGLHVLSAALRIVRSDCPLPYFQARDDTLDPSLLCVQGGDRCVDVHGN